MDTVGVETTETATPPVPPSSRSFDAHGLVRPAVIVALLAFVLLALLLILRRVSASPREIAA